MHQKGYNEDMHIMKVWLLAWKKHWLRLICLSCSLGLVSAICNLKNCWWWCVKILKCRPWERGLHTQTYLFEWLCPKATCSELTCRKTSERFFGEKLVFQLKYIFHMRCLFSLRHSNFLWEGWEVCKETLWSLLLLQTGTSWFCFFVLKFLNTISKFSASEAMSGTSSHLYSNGYFCVFQEARNKNQMILVLKKEHTLSQCTSFRGNYHLSLLQKVLQW